MTDDKTLVSAVRRLAVFFDFEDGITAQCLHEAANRLEDLSKHYSDLCKTHEATLGRLKKAEAQLRATNTDE